MGTAIKRAQRDWCLARGITTMTWTFDPLIRRNATFNIARLQAVGVSYHPDYYGPMDDGYNAGVPTDRVLVRWDLTAGSTPAGGAPHAVEGPGPHRRTSAARTAARPGHRRGRPARRLAPLPHPPAAAPPRGPAPSTGPEVRLRVPGTLHRDRELLSVWRPALRDAMSPLLDAGHRWTGVTRDGWYVLTLPGPHLTRSTHENRIGGTAARRHAVGLPFRTSFGTQSRRDVLLVRVITPEAEGWAECVAMAEPLYSSEYAGAAHRVTAHLLPRLFACGDVTAAAVASALAPVRGHRMAKAAVEAAVLDAELKAAGVPLSRHLGATQSRIVSGVSVGIHESVPELLKTVGGCLAEGYAGSSSRSSPAGTSNRSPPCARSSATTSFSRQTRTRPTRADARHLAGLDPYGLLMLEQPLEEEDVATPSWRGR